MSKEKSSVGDNLPPQERKALKDIMKWETEIVRPYDKGKGFVIDTVDNYKSRMYKDLNDTNVYYKLTELEASTVGQDTNKILQCWAMESLGENGISEKLAKWMVNDKAKPGKIYQLYKAHKPEKGYPGRTIASVCQAPIERISKWLEWQLAPIAKKISLPNRGHEPRTS